MKRLLAVFLVLVSGTALETRPREAFAQLEPVRSREEAPFELSLGQEFGELSQPLLVVSTSMPYRWLVFFVRGTSFESRYRVLMEIKDARGTSVRGEVWEETVSASDFKETTSATISATSQRTFPILPGQYRVAVTIEVIDTSRRFSREKDVRIVGREGGMVGVSAPVFYTISGDSMGARPPAGRLVVARCRAEDVRTFAINSSGVYKDFDSWARLVFTVATAEDQGEAALVTRIRDSRGRMILYNRTRLGASEEGHFTACVDVNLDAFPLGQYEVNGVVEGAEGPGAGMSRASFTVLLNRSLLDVHFGDLVAMIAPIATDAERQAFAGSPPAERRRAWETFWKRHDPTPSTETNEAYETFLERLMVVVKSFSRLRPGWLTDMGKIYLKNGPPDAVEDRQDTSLSRSFQLWYYHSKGVVYIFEDSVGNGDYRLYTTEMI
jgi:GWxTD domain-containing protein